jgi:hypothetical protein
MSQLFDSLLCLQVYIPSDESLHINEDLRCFVLGACTKLQII